MTDDSTIASQKGDTGSEAREFAAVMRRHTLEATGGQTYAQMGRYPDDSGKPTSDQKLAAKEPMTAKPVDNPLRQLWVTETALSTALNTAYSRRRRDVRPRNGVALLSSAWAFSSSR